VHTYKAAVLCHALFFLLLCRRRTSDEFARFGVAARAADMDDGFAVWDQAIGRRVGVKEGKAWDAGKLWNCGGQEQPRRLACDTRF